MDKHIGVVVQSSAAPDIPSPHIQCCCYCRRPTVLHQGEENVDVLPQEGADSSGANRTRITTRFLTKYERARILGTRALQIRWVGWGDECVCPLVCVDKW